MHLKTAASLALSGLILLTILSVADFIKTASGVLNAVVSVVALVRSLVYTFASLAVTVFFFAFAHAQSRTPLRVLTRRDAV